MGDEIKKHFEMVARKACSKDIQVDLLQFGNDWKKAHKMIKDSKDPIKTLKTAKILYGKKEN